MKNKTTILLVVALVCGLGAAYLTSKVIADRSKQPAEEKIEVLVAKAAVPQFKPVKEPEKLFTKKAMSKNDIPKGALTSFEEVKNKRLKVPLSADKVITQADLLDEKTASAGLAPVVPEGHRAVAIKVTADSAVGNHVLPHSRVDIIAALRENSGKSTAQMILQDVLVLAVGTVSSPNENTQSIQAPTVTVAVTPEDAMRLKLAAQVSELSLALRSPGDEAKETVKPVKIEDVIKVFHGDDTLLAGDKKGGTTTGTVSVGGLPLPPIEKKPVEEEKFDQPKPVWVVTVRNGDRVRNHEFFRDKNGAIVSGSDQKGPIEAKKDEPTPPATEGGEPTGK